MADPEHVEIVNQRAEAMREWIPETLLTDGPNRSIVNVADVRIAEFTAKRLTNKGDEVLVIHEKDDGIAVVRTADTLDVLVVTLLGLACPSISDDHQTGHVRNVIACLVKTTRIEFLIVLTFPHYGRLDLRTCEIGAWEMSHDIDTLSFDHMREVVSCAYNAVTGF